MYMKFVICYIFEIIKTELFVNSAMHKVPLISDINFMRH